ncbi:peptidoglycan DD-metalloendopeptidase family protein [Marinicella sp. S1101]|uniref:peptidoglycan DD-metalloendopeptidase family protein n=1 Tax=Marinicella marina TaxID=2996016 RepID=UPI002260EBFB|nr:peptidoglycan DD-metalloendopeptidase family protein [Marinicella marina]MCX7554037.1 peptidoglycan DD-metalloendopeptidase family protein [Marinicella marina]MDJ1140529.1 peptidoglycan DD-metalloendopeptidase family protein [Marinicella marina]
MRKAIILLIILCLVACAPRRPAKVDEVGTKPHRSHTKSYARHSKKDQQQKTHKVVKGDSLYSIGFRYQKDYKQLAAINNIKPPYRIYPNQILKLTGEPDKVVFSPSKNTTVETKPIVSNKPIVARNEATNKNTNKATNNQPKPTNKQANKPASKPEAQAKTVPTTPTTQRPPAKKPMVVKTPNNSNLKWLWPTNGKIRTTFLASNPARKGISIGGQSGQPVKAAEAGVVVYSGNGLLGYGELIIIKHNDAFLSAYGHNKTLKVKEGMSVTRGQVIAELGSSGTNVNNLHFEIRKNGKPVNPLNYVKP